MTCTADGKSVGAISADHGDDVDLNYEPTVNPRPSGGYVWVVFTSRRMYGNEATIPPVLQRPARRRSHQEHHDQEALGRRGRSRGGARHRREPPGLLSARARAPRRQFARVLGARPVPRGWAVLPERRPVLQWLLRGGGGRRSARLQERSPGQHVLEFERQVHDGRQLLRCDEPLHQRVLHAAGPPASAQVNRRQ